MKRKANLRLFYVGINLLKEFRDIKLQKLEYSRDNTFYGKKRGFNVLALHINSSSNILTLRLFNTQKKSWNELKYEIIHLSKKESDFFLNLFKALDDEAKKFLTEEF